MSRRIWRWALLLWLMNVAMSVAADNGALRKASTIVANAIVWHNNNIQELINSGTLASTDIAALQTGMEAVPWGIKQNNKRLCAEEQLTATPARIEMKVGETFPLDKLILSSTAFGDFYFDKPMIKSWQFVTDNAAFDKKDMALHALLPGEATFTVMSLCKAKGVTSKPVTVAVQVVVTE